MKKTLKAFSKDELKELKLKYERMKKRRKFQRQKPRRRRY